MTDTGAKEYRWPTHRRFSGTNAHPPYQLKQTLASGILYRLVSMSGRLYDRQADELHGAAYE
jgi:hypothetical protein